MFRKADRSWLSGIQSAANRNVFMTVVDVNGALVSQQLAYATAPACTLYLPLSGLAQGLYFLRVSTAEGTVSNKTLSQVIAWSPVMALLPVIALLPNQEEAVDLAVNPFACKPAIDR